MRSHACYLTSRLAAAGLFLGLLAALAGCHTDDAESGFTSGGNAAPPPTSAGSDVARRAVLADIGEDIILPALRDFAEQAGALQAAIENHAASPTDADALAAAREAWRAAMLSWQRNEVLQVGPAGRSRGLDATLGGADLRSQIYSFPFFGPCQIDEAALNSAPVNANTAINIRGLGALEYLLFFDGANPACPPANEAELISARAAYAQRLADFIDQVAADLRNRWEPAGGNFLAQWSDAGAGSSVYSRPQDALDALSNALFYVEQETKDRKLAGPTGIGANNVDACGQASCPERLESPFADSSGSNIGANIRAFRDLFTGVDGGMGVNALLRGIGRDDLADEIIPEIDAALDQLDNVIPDYDTAVPQIPSNSACINASSNPSQTSSDVSPCALHGLASLATDTFRGPVVSALSLATPNRAAGDND